MKTEAPRLARVATWIGRRLRRRPPPEHLSDRLRRDIGLEPRGPMSRQLDRARFGLPL